MAKDNKIMPNSNLKLCNILMPNKGKLLKNKGNKAQCIAQANEAPMPIASQFHFLNILQR
jgi:hypothetical protein